MVTPALPVAIQTMVIKQQGTTIYYPAVVGLQDQHVQQNINQTIIQLMQFLVHQQYEQQRASAFTEMIGTFEIKTNERNILSLTLSNYAIAYQYAHGLTLMKSLTFDTQSGKNYTLQELFRPGSNYIDTLSQLVQKQIHARDIQLLSEFPGISPDQDFYISDKVLVLYFQAYEITPGYVGLPMFPISVYKLQQIIDENGPLGRMADS
ncbi:DUF3298 and DUF4163 domain-containing protein [Virgibacillus saliphilus]|uniref:DUF3298 and DUF4163 domain-containing protein n=1 Tax=Virgibacillus saliphilus TaxID=2831674 RepID=UPI002102D991|nr:DUF3298 and DUF4163 domain-containing protein [Virgibacillus sp. NKC19-3]